MESLWQLLVFAGECFLVVTSIGLVALIIALLAAKSSSRPELEIERLDRRFEKLARRVSDSLLTPKNLKKELKKRKKDEKENEEKPRTFVLDFKGDIKASATDQLREEVSAVLGATKPEDEVILRLESPGGIVHGYGLAAAQLMRIRKAGLKLTICVDKVAASGGYMMACTADKIIAAPFAVIGSVGVVAQVPNLHRLLKKHDVDYKEYTAGEFKRTVSFLGEITPKGEEKFLEQLNDTHVLFKSFVQSQRPKLDVSKIATGEHWYGAQALELGLIDEIQTSDEYLQTLAASRALVSLKLQKKQSMGEKLSGVLGKAIRRGISESVDELQTRPTI